MSLLTLIAALAFYTAPVTADDVIARSAAAVGGVEALRALKIFV